MPGRLLTESDELGKHFSAEEEERLPGEENLPPAFTLTCKVCNSQWTVIAERGYQGAPAVPLGPRNSLMSHARAHGARKMFQRRPRKPVV